MSAPKYQNACPVCFAYPNQPCRTLTTNRVTDTHMRRVQGEDPGVLVLACHRYEPCPICRACGRCFRGEHGTCHGCRCGCQGDDGMVRAENGCQHGQLAGAS